MNSYYVSGKFYSWKSDADLSRQLKKPSTYVKYLRAYKNLSYREIIQESVNDVELSCIVNGTEYRWYNNIDLSELIGWHPSYIKCCLKNGMSYEKIIYVATTNVLRYRDL